jgi:hypothetical protein
VNYEDVTIIRLSDESSRREVFGDTALEQIVATAYDTQSMSIEGPFQPIFDELQLGFAVPRIGVMEGGWYAAGGGGQKVEARFQVSGHGNNDMIRVDALWRGAIIARTVPGTAEVTEVETTWPELSSIDADIEAALGSLPTDSERLERERRLHFLTRMRATLDQPDAMTEETLDRWLDQARVDSVDTLLKERQSGVMRILFSPHEMTPPSPMRLPISAAVLIRDAGFSLAQLLMESKIVREQLESLGLEKPVNPPLKIRHPLVVVWILPEAIFEDDDWPGGEPGMDPAALRRARRAAAGRWLAREGIGLIATP